MVLLRGCYGATTEPTYKRASAMKSVLKLDGVTGADALTESSARIIAH